MTTYDNDTQTPAPQSEAELGLGAIMAIAYTAGQTPEPTASFLPSPI